MPLPLPLYHLQSRTDDTVQLTYAPPFDTLDGTYLLRGGIASPAVDAMDIDDGALVVAGYDIQRGITFFLAEWAWQRLDDTILDGQLRAPGGWRHFAEAWRSFGVRSWLYADTGRDIETHRPALRLPGLEFGVGLICVSVSPPMAVAQMIADMRAATLYVPQADPAKPDSRLLRALATTRADRTPPPPVLAAISALARLDRASAHWRSEHVTP